MWSAFTFFTGVGPAAAMVLDPDHETPTSRTALESVAHSRPWWSVMPQVWWPWMSDLVCVEIGATSVVINLISSEQGRVNNVRVPPGTPFALRTETIVDDDRLALLGWLEASKNVTILAGRDGRSTWVCLSHRHERIVLEGVLSDLRGLLAQFAERPADERSTSAVSTKAPFRDADSC